MNLYSYQLGVPRVAFFAFVLLAGFGPNRPANGQDISENACGSLQNSVGPFDYRNPANAGNKQDVETNHFNSSVESLRGGMTSVHVGADIDFVLRVFPNHPRALWAMSRLSLRDKQPRPQGARYTIDCYFDRAIRFQPEDGTVRLVYGLHLIKAGNPASAIRHLELARQFGEGNANLHYNLGLAYFELGDYDRALLEARRAYELGFPLSGLRDKLQAAGRWEK